MRPAGLNFSMESWFEEKLQKINSIRHEDFDLVVIDMTDKDSQGTIPYVFSEGEEVVNNVENDDDLQDNVSYF